MPINLKPIPKLGLNLRQARERLDLTQLALAHKMGYAGDNAGAYVSRIENGLSVPSLGTLQKLAGALGVAVSSLLGETSSRSSTG